MFSRDFMIRANDRPLQERPDTLNGIGMHITSYPFLLRVVDRFVPCIGIPDTPIGRPFIGIDSFGVLSISEMGHFLNRTLRHNQVALASSLRPWL